MNIEPPNPLTTFGGIGLVILLIYLLGVITK